VSPSDGATETEPTTVVASEVRVGDVLRSRDGTEFTVSRIDDFSMFGPPLIAFIEDSDVRWFKMPSAVDGEVTLVRRGA
jgi:hypothetical protein